MDKKAKLVEFSIMTRVLVDDKVDGQALELQAFHLAKNKILDDPRSFLYIENMIEIEDDEECPYDPEFDKDL